MEGILPPNLLNNLRLNDRLIIKGTRYIINKITSNLVDRRDQLELINDIYSAPLVSDVLNTSFFRQARQVFDSGAQDYSFTYVGLSGKDINLVDLGDRTGHLELEKTKNSELSKRVVAQQGVIANLQKDQTAIRQILGNINSQNEQQRKDLKDLKSRFSTTTGGAPRRLDKLAAAKPGLIEPIINKATANAARCLEIASGAPLTNSERSAKTVDTINTECPAIANPNFISSK
jgi:hypothetical protein